MTLDCSEYIVVFQVNGIGDQLMAWPTMRALNTLFPKRLRLVTSKSMPSMLFRDVPFADKLRVDFKSNNPRDLKYEEISKELLNTEVFINLCEWLNEPVWNLINTIQPRHTIGFQNCFHDVITVAKDTNTFDRTFQVTQVVDDKLQISDFSEPPVFSPAATDAAHRLKSKYVHSGEKILFLHPETLPEKQWSPVGFSKVLDLFLDARPEYKVFICSLKPSGISVSQRNISRVVHISPHLELSLALVGLCDTFLGIDSCFMHAADLYRLPSVALFGPTDPKIWGFRFAKKTRTIQILAEQSLQSDVESLNIIEVYESLMEVSREETL